jgi:hypothetical protein
MTVYKLVRVVDGNEYDLLTCKAETAFDAIIEFLNQLHTNE